MSDSKILLVEDDPALGSATAELLTLLGRKTIWVDSQERAFSLLANANEISVVLLDLQLGEQRGEMLIQLLRALSIRIPPLIIFSAQPIAELTHSAKAIGALAILQKPCSASQIEAAINLVSAR